MLAVLAGLPGTGKTAVACELERLGWRRVSRDEVMPGLFGSATRFGDAGQKQAAFQEMLRIAEALLRRGDRVLLEGMLFRRRSDVASAQALAARCGVPFRCLLCTCPEDLALQRIRAQRGSHPATDRDDALYRRAKAAFEPIEVEHLALDTSRPVDETVKACLDYLH